MGFGQQKPFQMIVVEQRMDFLYVSKVFQGTRMTADHLCLQDIQGDTKSCGGQRPSFLVHSCFS